MRWTRALSARLRRRAVAGEVDDELAFHLAMRVQEFMDRGMSAEAARAEAMRRMGDVDRVRGECRALGEAKERDVQRTEWLQAFGQDLKFAARQLGRARALTAVAALTLALGIGATAAIFGIVDAVVLRPLPYADPSRVMQLRGIAHAGEPNAVSNANFLDWHDGGARAFSSMAAEVRVGLTLTRAGSCGVQGECVPQLLESGRVSGDYFRVFGVRAAFGRTLVPDDDAPGRRVAVLGHRAWVKWFGADSSIVGRAIELSGAPYTVVGVMPASFDVGEDAESLWLPLGLTAEERASRGAGYLTVFGRLRAGTSLAAAQTTMDAVARRLDRQYPDQNHNVGVRVRPLAQELTGEYQARLLTLLGAVAFVLLIGCANVANLLLARGAARAKELAVRATLGAGRARIVRQLLTESVLLGLVGGALGAALAVGGVKALVAISPPGVPRIEQAGVDARLLAFTFLLSLASSVVFGLAPALKAVRPDLQSTLRSAGRGTAGSASDRLRSALVTAEVALALVLLTGAGLLTRSAVLLRHVQPGFDPHGVLISRLMLPEGQYADATHVVDTFRRIADEVRRAPGVASAGLVLTVPLTDDNANASVTAEGKPFVDENRLPVQFRIASPGLFDALGIPIRRGRDFTDRDDAAAPRVAIINETLARTLWPGQDAVGRRLTALTASPTDPLWTEVVGVVRDVHEHALGDAPQPEVYYPVPQTNPKVWPLIQRSLVLVARAKVGDAAALERPLRHAVAAIDPQLPLGDVQPMTDLLADSLATSRFMSLLLAALSTIGLALAIVGIYGIIAYFVTQRASEIGVRMALGATPRAVLALVVRGAMRPVTLGVALGTLAAIALSRLLQGFLFGVAPTDPLTIGGVILLLVGAALAASVIPARRAARVEPAEVAKG